MLIFLAAVGAISLCAMVLVGLGIVFMWVGGWFKS